MPLLTLTHVRYEDDLYEITWRDSDIVNVRCFHREDNRGHEVQFDRLDASLQHKIIESGNENYK